VSSALDLTIQSTQPTVRSIAIKKAQSTSQTCKTSSDNSETTLLNRKCSR